MLRVWLQSESLLQDILPLTPLRHLMSCIIRLNVFTIYDVCNFSATVMLLNVPELFALKRSNTGSTYTFSLNKIFKISIALDVNP